MRRAQAIQYALRRGFSKAQRACIRRLFTRPKGESRLPPPELVRLALTPGLLVVEGTGGAPHHIYQEHLITPAQAEASQ